MRQELLGDPWQSYVPFLLLGPIPVAKSIQHLCVLAPRHCCRVAVPSGREGDITQRQPRVRIKAVTPFALGPPFLLLLCPKDWQLDGRCSHSPSLLQGCWNTVQ